MCVRHPPDNGKHVDDRQMPQKMIGRVIENVPHRIFNAAHDALHPVNGSQIMTAVYPLAAANHFMGRDLSDGEDEVKATTCNEPVHWAGMQSSACSPIARR